MSLTRFDSKTAIRGGAWVFVAYLLPLTHRNAFDPSYCFDVLGVRFVRRLP